MITRIMLCSLFAVAVSQLTAQEYPLNDDWNTAAAAQIQPRIAKHQAGPAMVVWGDARNDAAYPDIYLQFLGWKGFPLPGKLNIQVNEESGACYHMAPDVAMTGLGNSIVVWHENSSGHYAVMAQRYRANADTDGGNFEVSGGGSADHMFPSVAAADAGQFIIVWTAWHDAAAWNGDVYAQWYDPLGNPTGGAYCVNLDTTGAQYNPRIAMASNGRFVIVWAQRLSGIAHIFARVFDAAGQSLGPEFQVSQEPLDSGYMDRPDVAIREDGAFMVVWHAPDGDGHYDVHARGYDSSAMPQSDEFMVNQRYGLEDHKHPDVDALINTSFGIVWQSNRLASNDLYYRVYALNGISYIPEETITNASGDQTTAALVTDGYQNRLCVWQDTRNSNPDIYISNTGLNLPNHAFAGGGFEGMIPLAWDPPYMDTRVVNYTITRQQGSGPYETVAVIDPSSRPLPNRMLDWIDTGVENGKQYRYRIKMEVPESIGEFTDVWATPSAGGHRISSPWTRITPDIDGTIYSTEWDDGLEFYIDGSESRGQIRLRIKNDAEKLYLAFSDVNTDRLTPAYMFGMLCDGNNSGTWPASGLNVEGAVSFFESNAVFTSFSGTWPDGLVIQNHGEPAGVEWAFRNAGGWIMFEAALDLTQSPLQAMPGDTIGAAFWISDPGTFFDNPYGNSGAWPQGALREAAETLGKIALASPADTLQEYAWTMLNHDKRRTSWANDETALKPPFDSSRIIPVSHLFVSTISFYDDTYYLGASQSDLPNRFLSLDAGTETLNWNFDVPNSTSALSFHPAVSHKYVYCGGQHGDGLFALDRGMGYEVWSDPIGSLLRYSPIIDGSRLYITQRDTLYCCNASDGHRNWKFVPASSAGRIYNDPALDDQFCYLSAEDSIWALNKYSGTVIWQKPTSGLQCLIVDEGLLYTYSFGAVRALHKYTGNDYWVRVVDEQDTLHSYNKMALAENTLCFAITRASDNKGHLLALDAYNGSVLWRRDFNQQLSFTPTIANNVVYLIDWDNTDYYGSLWALDLVTGDSLFHNTSRDYRGQPVVAGHRLLVPGKGNGFTVFWNEGGSTGIEPPADSPDQFVLSHNYPNPFNPETNIRYRLPCLSDVSMKVIDLRGRCIRRWNVKGASPGDHTQVWDGRNEEGNPVPSGVYFFRLQQTGLSGDTGKRTQSIKMVLVK